MAFILLVRRRLPSATLFPYTTLFRSQQQAVRHGPSPLLIIAGAGTGKTLTLAHRVAQLIESGVAPERVLLLTFTRRAAEAMLQRVEAIRHPPQAKTTPRGKQATTSAGGGKVWGGTF